MTVESKDHVTERVERWVVLNRSILTQGEKECIELGGKLNDEHINFAQLLLKQQFQHLGGLKSTLTLPYLVNKFTLAHGALQIIHDRGDHWIVASTLHDKGNCEILVYDSVYTKVDSSTRNLLLELFGPEFKITLTTCQRQEGVKDCGVFAIAVCTSLAHNLKPAGFYQPAMRAHLIKCFQDFHLTPFS